MILKKFKEELLGKETFCSSLTGKKVSDKENEHVLKVWNRFQMKRMKDYTCTYTCDLYLKYALLLTDVLVINIMWGTRFKLGCNAQNRWKWSTSHL